MCGFVGVIGNKEEKIIDRNLLEKSTKAIYHRGPDSEGYYEDATTIYIELDTGKIYEVNMEAECEGNKTDYGERIYFVDKITSVTFKDVGELWVVTQQLKQLDYEKKEVAEKFEAICSTISGLEDRKLDLEKDVEALENGD